MAEHGDVRETLEKGLSRLTIAVQSINPDPAQTIQAYRDQRGAQQRAADHLVTATDALVQATHRLAAATWVLVVLTGITALAAVAQVLSVWLPKR